MAHDLCHFESLDSLLAHVQALPASVGTGRLASLRSDREGGFYGTNSWETAMRYAREGWPAGLEQLNAARALLSPPEPVAAIVPLPCIAEEGDEVAIDRFLDGESACWIDYPQSVTPARGRVVALYVHIGGLCNVQPESFANRGAAAIAIVDALESAGYRVELWLMARSECTSNSERAARGDHWDLRCLVKRPQDPLDFDALAFWLMNPAAFRRIGFRTKELTPRPYDWLSGYGRTVAIPDSDLPEGAVQIPAPTGQTTPAQAADMARAILNRILEPAAA